MPRSPKAKLTASAPAERWAGTTLEDGAAHESLLIASADLAGQQARGARFDDVHVVQTSLAGVTLSDLELNNVRFEECDLSNAVWEQAFARLTVFKGCRMTGFSVIEAILRHVHFQDCSARLARFRFARFDKPRFERCDLREADFQGAELSGAVFAACDLRGAEMAGAKLASVDLRGCQIEGARLQPDQLRGGTVDLTQAVYLIEALGINVEDLAKIQV